MDVVGILMGVAKANRFPIDYTEGDTKDARWALHIRNPKNGREISFIPHFPTYNDDYLEGWNCRDGKSSRIKGYDLLGAIRRINNLR